MAQYDLWLTQNVHASGTEFQEKLVNLGDKELLVGGTNGALNKIAKGTAVGQILKINSVNGTFLWADNSGTPLRFFTIGDVNDNGVSLRKYPSNDNPATHLSVEDEEGDRLPLYAGRFIASESTTSESDDKEVTTKDYVDGLNSAITNAFVLKGIIKADAEIEGDPDVDGQTFGTGFTADYKVGWTFKITVAQTINGVVYEIGDTVLAWKNRGGSFQWTDFTVLQTNISGAVTTAETASVAGDLALFTGNPNVIKKLPTGAVNNGKILKVESGKPVWADENPGFLNPMEEAGDLIIGKVGGDPDRLAKGDNGQVLAVSGGQVTWKNEFTYTHDTGFGNQPAEVLAGKNVISQILVNAEGHVTGVNQRALELSDLGARKAWVSAPTGPNWNTAAGTAGDEAYDANFYYICVADGHWRRMPLANKAS